jgi:hypothetical protein
MQLSPSLGTNPRQTLSDCSEGPRVQVEASLGAKERPVGRQARDAQLEALAKLIDDFDDPEGQRGAERSALLDRHRCGHSKDRVGTQVKT